MSSAPPTPAASAGPAGRARIASTHAYPRRPEWVSRVDVVYRPGDSWSAQVRRLVGDVASRYELMILDGSIGIPRSPELASAALIARRRRPPGLMLTECNWKPGSGSSRLLRHIGIRAVDRAVVRYCVYTTDELEAFPRRWGVDPDKMAFTPFYYHLSDEELAQAPIAGDHVFSGGDSLRDYETLAEVARRLPSIPFRIASATAHLESVPGNVEVGRVPHAEYIQLVRSAAVLVVPLRAGVIRTAGLETFLTGMALGKLIITTDSPGIRDYVDDHRTGLIVPPGDAAAMTEAIAWAVDPANADEVARIAAAGRESARRDFSPDAYVARLLEIADEALA
jgi:glycosyltransferase involved in cell wall biosynthesis